MAAIQILLVTFFVAAAFSQDSGYMYIPDGDGNLHLVNLEATSLSASTFDGSSDVTLYLYTQSNPTTSQTLAIGSVPDVFDVSNPTRIVIHGWNSAASHMDEFREAYIATGDDYNIILVDWSDKASALYTSAKTSAINVGKYVAEVVENLISTKDFDVGTLYIIGHSLGAHAAGVAGYNLNASPAKIVGLDAAAPLFGSETLANRLDSTDAQFVEAIHTNGGTLGWKDPLAKADFFPNGGSSQPGCGLDLAGACSHSRSHIYYSESIKSKKFVGISCSTYKLFTSGSCSGDSTAIMGEWTSTSASGSYYLDTYSSSPYAEG